MTDTKRYHLRLDPALADKIEKRAKKLHVSANDILKMIIAEHIAGECERHIVVNEVREPDKIGPGAIAPFEPPFNKSSGSPPPYIPSSTKDV